MNAPWEREVARALRLAGAVLHPAPALPGAGPLRALAADPAARFDALLSGLLQGPDAPPSAPPAEDVPPRAASPFASAAPERREGGWGFPPSAGPSALHAADPAPPASPLFRVPVSRLFADDAPRPAASAGDPRPAGFDPPSAFGGFAVPRADTPWPGREGWTPAAPPPPSSPAVPPSADARREVDGWTPAPPPSSPAFPPFAWEDAGTGDSPPSPWDADPRRGAVPDGERRMEGAAPIFPGVRVARSTADLRALLQAHVASPDLEAPPAFPPFDPAPPAARLAEGHPAETAFPDPRPHAAGDGLVPPSAGGVPAVAAPDAGGAAYFPAFPGAEAGPGALAEEMLLERLMDRMEARAREDSLRRFGLTGGF